MRENDRLILHTIHTDDGATEVYFGRARDDFSYVPEGSLLFHSDASVTWKAWTDAEVPVVVTIKGNVATVAITEDQPADDDTVVFDTRTLSEDSIEETF